MASFNTTKPGHKNARYPGTEFKQTRQTLNLEMKLQIVDLLEKGKSVGVLGRCLGVPESTIRTIGKNKHKLKKCALIDTRYRVKDVDLINMEAMLLSWIEDQNERQVILSPGMVTHRAFQMYNYLSKNRRTDGRVKFAASVGWYEKFRDRNNLSNKVTGHAAFNVYNEVANARLANLFIFDFKNYIESEQYRPDQIFCVKETKLFWKKIPGMDSLKPAVDRMVLILSSNMAANVKCKPTVIISMKQNTSDKLHSNGCECCDLPVNWYAKDTTWMNSGLFKEWLEKLFVPEVKSYCQRLDIPFKILLLLEKNPSHQDLPKIPNVNIMYLPQTTDSITNPMNHGIITEFQICYLKKTLQAVFEIIDTGFHKNLTEVWNNFGKNDAIDLIGQTWNGISETTMKDAWAYITGEEEDTQSKEARMADEIELCLQLLGKLMGDCFSDSGKDEIMELLESHNEELSNEELADLLNVFPSTFNKKGVLDLIFDERFEKKRRKMEAEDEQGVSGKKYESDFHSIESSENEGEESAESVDPTTTYKVESLSPEITDFDVDEPQNELDEAITGRIKMNCSDNLNKKSSDFEQVEIDDCDEESERSFGNSVEDQEITDDPIKEERETQQKYQLDKQISDEEPKPLCQICKIESPSDVIEISDEESRAESEAIVTKRIKLSSFNDVKLEPEDLDQPKVEVRDLESQLFFEAPVKIEENLLKKECEDLDYEEGEVTENKMNIERNSNNIGTSANTTERPTIAQLQKLIGLTYQLIAKSLENDDDSARCDQFIANVEDAMRPYKMLLDLKLGGDELW